MTLRQEDSQIPRDRAGRRIEQGLLRRYPQFWLAAWPQRRRAESDAEDGPTQNERMLSFGSSRRRSFFHEKGELARALRAKRFWRLKIGVEDKTIGQTAGATGAASAGRGYCKSQ